MAADEPMESPGSGDDLASRLRALEGAGRALGPRQGVVVGGVCAAWSLFQLWIASPLPFLADFGIIVDVPARAVHLAFGLLLCFLVFPARKGAEGGGRIPLADLVLALLAAGCALYVCIFQAEITRRLGVLLDAGFLGVTVPVEALVGGVGIVLLLEATRRGVGLPLVIVCVVFLFFTVFGQSMPGIIAHKGVSLDRLIGYQWFTGEAIFGIPIDVSVSFVFMFVLFGALLERAGAGQYFLDLAFAMVGRYRGGPAKAAILASGMNGAISGSSIANVVTTGTFTIPVMRSIGIPAVKAGAIEVAASTNGQLMPPIMGAAAFIIAETIGIPYFEVVVAAFIPAVISYMALLYISHLEALKLGLKGLPETDIPPIGPTFRQGAHFLIPIVVLVWLLMVERWTAGSAVFYSIVVMMAIMVAQRGWREWARRDEGGSLAAGLLEGLSDVGGGLVAGARNMVAISVAVAAAGIIVGSVASTGLNNAMVGVVEAVSGGNVYVLLVLTAMLCILLGMGLPTTANYLVVASLLAGVLVELGNAAGLVLPLIAVHLFVFYFGLLADSTPPVCLAAFAAAAISRADPLKTGVQSFLYDIRTALLPFVFVFNPELLLVGVTSLWHGVAVFAVSLTAMLCFCALTQRWLFVRLRLYEMALLVFVVVALFRPGFVMDFIHPEFDPLPMDRFVAGQAKIEPGRAVRFHVVRETDYGDRFKLFVMTAPDGAAGPAAFGLSLGDAGEDGRRAIEQTAFQGAAEKAGIRAFEDYVTGMDLASPGRPAREWIWLLGYAVLALVLAGQLARRRRAGDGG
jgi:TRAP transporter 4TM/12TM fusion protein